MTATGIWDGDLLGREEDGKLIYRLLVNRYLENEYSGQSGSYVLNIDGKWGQGKSFLLDRMYQEVLSKKHCAVFINAWKYDFVDDPFSLVVSSIDDYFKAFEKQVPKTLKKKFQKGLENLRHNFGAVAIATGKEVGKTLARKAFGEGGATVLSALEGDEKKIGAEEKSTTAEIIDAVGVGVASLSDAAIDKYAQQRLDDLRKTTDSIANFKENLTELLKHIPKKEGYALPFFVFVDELDRCRPTYAIGLLERIKHIFDVEGMIFVMATDTEQLSHSINNVYGNNFDSKQYLQRFFNRSYRLPDATFERLALNKIEKASVNTSKWTMPPKFATHDNALFAKLLSKTAEIFELSTRQFEQSLDILQDVTTIWSEEYPIELTTMYAIVCEYAKHRKIDKDTEASTHKLLTNNSKWVISTDEGTIELWKYRNAGRSAMSDTMLEWTRNMRRTQPMPRETTYIYELLSFERSRRMTGQSEEKEPFTNLINYQRVVLNNSGFS
ncbi:hypothetical protein A6U96_13920 [Agrobacterium tumefaciens]|nr:hypothetical protein A6U96_13920 [Agrobacterium tumefaciens]